MFATSRGCWTQVKRPPRRVYIDAGANWANTLRLYDELGTIFPDVRAASSQPWEIYAFEASPVIHPFVEEFVKYLNGLVARPTLLVPPIGSSRTHGRYSKMFNCTSRAGYGTRKREMYECLYARFERHIMDHIRLAYSKESASYFYSSRLIAERLREAREPNNDPAGRPRYTFIPAAIGNQSGWLDINWRFTQQFLPFGMRNPPDPLPVTTRVQSIDFVQWLCDHFQPSDHVLIKFDIEGSLHL
jgi:hypothetical protein